MQELREVYKAPTEEVALNNLDLLDEHWGGNYTLAVRSWRNNWANLATYFKYPEEIRTIIYTTNAVEALHRQFRKVTKSKSLFPNDDAPKKNAVFGLQGIIEKMDNADTELGYCFIQLLNLF